MHEVQCIVSSDIMNYQSAEYVCIVEAPNRMYGFTNERLI